MPDCQENGGDHAYEYRWRYVKKRIYELEGAVVPSKQLIARLRWILVRVIFFRWQWKRRQGTTTATHKSQRLQLNESGSSVAKCDTNC